MHSSHRRLQSSPAEEGDVVLTVAVDRELCAGNGNCVRLAPTAFRIDEGSGTSSAVPEGLDDAGLDLLVRAARQCPTNAIRVVDDDGTVLVKSA
jgi:ferredoxin